MPPNSILFSSVLIFSVHINIFDFCHDCSCHFCSWAQILRIQDREIDILSVTVYPLLPLEALKRPRVGHAGHADRHPRCCAGQQNFPIGERTGKRWVVQGLASQQLETSWVRPLRMRRLLESVEAVVRASEILASEN